MFVASPDQCEVRDHQQEDLQRRGLHHDYREGRPPGSLVCQGDIRPSIVMTLTNAFYLQAASITSTSAVISWLPSNSNFQHTVSSEILPSSSPELITEYQQHHILSDHSKFNI